MQKNNDKPLKQVSRAMGWLIWLMPTFFMFYQYGVQTTPSIKIEYLHTHYLIGNFKIGLLSTFYLLPYAILQIPSGLLVDSYDTRKILSGGMLLFALGTAFIFLSNYASSYPAYALGHLCMGIGASSAFVAAIYLANVWLPAKDYKIAVSLVSPVSILGVLVVGLVFAHILNFANWDQLIAGNFIFTLVISLIFWLTIKDKPKSNTINFEKMFEMLKLVLQNKKLWLCGIFVSCISSNIFVLTNIWRIVFLEETYHISEHAAAMDNGYSIIGFMVGCPVFGYIATKLDTHKSLLLMALSSLLLCILLAICHFYITDLSLKIQFYFAIGFLTGAGLLVYLLIRDFISPDVLGTATGFVNTLQVFVTMAAIPLVGELQTLFSGDYQLATIPVIVETFIGAMLAFVLWRMTASQTS